MDWKDLFLNFGGRISRKSWWIGFVLVQVVQYGLNRLLPAVLGTNTDTMSPIIWQPIIVLAIIAYPLTALSSKRLNDRDRPSWLKWVFWSPNLLILPGMALGVMFGPPRMIGTRLMPSLTPLGWASTVLAVIIGVGFIIECGFLRGKSGPNRFGQDPLA